MILSVGPAGLSLGLPAGYERKKGANDAAGVLGLSIWMSDVAISEVANAKKGWILAGIGGGILRLLYTC